MCPFSQGGPESWPPEPVWVTFLFQMKQIKKSCKSGNFFEKKNSQNDVCVYSACRSAAIMLSVLCSGTTRGDWRGLNPLQPKMGGPHKLSKSDEFFYRGRGGDDSVDFYTMSCRSGYRIISVWTESIALACQIAKISSRMVGSCI